MKTFLINEQYKKTTKGGKWICRVFMLENDTVEDITEIVAELWNSEKEYDWINLTIYYWSWTGYTVISEILRMNWWNSISIINVSIF